MAERTKFISYCVYSAIISGLIYPIEAHWIWNENGWLAQLGFHDFAGSCAIHMVGGVSALIGAKILGPRIGKFTTDKNGKVTKVNAIPGHSLTLGALGCFILWFGWYGFNGAAASTGAQLGSIFLTTTIAPAIATVVCMVFTWVKYGKPDVSMCLNASLAGLVGITAGCDVMDAFGAIMVGVVSGLLVVFGVWLLDHKLHIDDPVGAVAVHMMNGIWGTFAVGLFATTTAPECEINGLFYGGGFSLLGIQCAGIVSVAAWTAVTMTIVFLAIKHTIGLRASVEEETRGLDVTEHGLASSYADFMPVINTSAINVFTGETTKPAKAKKAPVSSDDAVPVQVVTGGSKNVVASDVKLSKVDIICKLGKFDELKSALNDIGVTGITVSNVSGCGTQKGETAPMYRGAAVDMTLLPKIKVEVVVSTVPVTTVIAAAKKALYTGNIGDGKIFVYDVENVIKVRTGEEGVSALQSNDD
jgi:Amt family ammonium transporter